MLLILEQLTALKMFTKEQSMILLHTFISLIPQAKNSTLSDATDKVLHKNLNMPLEHYLKAENKRELAESRKTSEELAKQY